MLIKSILDWKQEAVEGTRNKVSEKKEIINIYAGTGTLILHHCYLNSTTNKIHSTLPSFLSPHIIPSYYHQISIPPQLFPSTNWLFLFNILRIFPSSPLLYFLKAHFPHFLYTHRTIYLHYPSPSPPSQLLAILSDSVPMSPLYKALLKLMPLYQLNLVTPLSRILFSNNIVITTIICLYVFLWKKLLEKHYHGFKNATHA